MAKEEKGLERVPSQLVDQKVLALTVAGEETAGTIGEIRVSMPAALPAVSARNAALFSTARLSRRVADNDELPATLAHRNHGDVPHRAVLVLGAVGSVVAAVGGLLRLVQTASLTLLLADDGTAVHDLAS